MNISHIDSNFFLTPGHQAISERLRWISIPSPELELRGLPWQGENGSNLVRFPARVEKNVTEAVWQLSQIPSGGHLAWKCDTTTLAIRCRLTDANFMAHMPLSGCAGLELYAGALGHFRQWSVAFPAPGHDAFFRVPFEGMEKKLREFRLYLPLYKGVASVEIGIDPDAILQAPTPTRCRKPVVFYGTSITQGGCASTSGSDFVSSIGRKLNVEAINLGFSGNGKGEPALAELLTEIDAALYVVDYANNVTPEQMEATLPRFLDILREKYPTTPILIKTSIGYSSSGHLQGTYARQEGVRDCMIYHYINRRRAGDANIHLADGYSLLPFNTDGAYVDGVHPTTHGFQMIADRLAPMIEYILFGDCGADAV